MWIWQWLKSTGPNFGQVAPGIYRSAQPGVDELKSYQERYDLRSVMNLRDGDMSKERDEAISLGLNFVHIPMSDRDVPQNNDVEKALLLLCGSGGSWLVQCKGGRHRTGLVVACYRVRAQGWSKENAWREAEDFGWYSAKGHAPLKRFFFDEFE